MKYFLLFLIPFNLLAAPGIGNNTPAVPQVGFFPPTTTIADTNNIFVTGAGTANANGQFTIKTRVGGNGEGDTWTNVNGITGITHFPNGDSPNLGFWELSNSVPTSLYEANNDIGNGLGFIPGGNWAITGGAGQTVPTVVYGTNLIGNQQAFSTIPLPVLVQTNIVYLSTNGLDQYAIKGRVDKPYGHFTFAITNLVAGDSLQISPGFYDASDYPAGAFQLPNNVSILGSGRGNVTTIHGADSGHAAIYLGNSNYVANLTFTNCWIYAGNVSATNIMLESVDMSATGDNVVFQAGSCGGTIVNCRFFGNSDKVADLSGAGSPGQNSYAIEMDNCEIYGGNGQDGNGLNLLGGVLKKSVNNCLSITASGARIINWHSSTNMSISMNGSIQSRTNLSPVGFNLDFGPSTQFFRTNNLCVFQPATNFDTTQLNDQFLLAIVTNTAGSASPFSVVVPNGFKTNAGQVMRVTNISYFYFHLRYPIISNLLWTATQ